MFHSKPDKLFFIAYCFETKIIVTLQTNTTSWQKAAGKTFF